MASRKEFQKISQTRLKEVKLLFRNGFYDGAVYICGYVVEAALKARICKILNEKNYPDSGEEFKSFKTHVFDSLIVLAGLKKELDNSTTRNKALKENLSLFTQSQFKSKKPLPLRYNPIGTHSKEDAKKIIDSVANGKNGILKWIKQRW